MKMIRFSFTAPLQSWGEDARWDSRSTAVRPTKSGIIGFLGCCLGYRRGDERLKELNQGIRVAIRTDRAGQILTDFHTVHGTDDVLFNAEGKKRSLGATIITPKQYLQDAWFTVFLQGNEGLLDSCFSAMQHPRWTPYLGRKNCVPSVPVTPEWVEADSLEEAVCCFSETDGAHCEPIVSVEMDLPENARLKETERIYSRKDNLIHAEKNEYGTRYVKSYSVQCGGDMS